jgi:hypothetical protein
MAAMAFGEDSTKSIAAMGRSYRADGRWDAMRR